MRDFTKQAIQKLNSSLQLPYEAWMQDWDILLADPTRIREFINIYDRDQLDHDEKFALMSLIISSYNNQLETEPVAEIENDVRRLLTRDYEIHKDRIQYWCCFDSVGSEYFAVTPLMRRLWKD